MSVRGLRRPLGQSATVQIARGAAVALIALLAAPATGSAAPGSRRCQPPQHGRNLVLVSARSGAVDRSFPDVDGNVLAAVADGSRGWFVAGAFTCVGRVRVPGLARLTAGGALDRGWTAQLPTDSSVHALTVSGETLYVAGSFGVEAVDRATAARRWLIRVPSAQQPVLALAATRHTLYAAGAFAQIGGRPRRFVAALSPQSGRVLAWRGPSSWSSRTSQISSLALGGTRLYVAGDFSSIGGRARPNVAALDARTGALTSWRIVAARQYTPGSGVGEVDTILASHGDLLAAGRDGWGVVDVRTGAIRPWMYRVGARGFTVHGPIAYLSGNCRNALTQAGGARRNGLAAIDLRTDRFTAWAPHVARFTCVDTLAASATEVLAAGFFGASLG